MSVHRLILVGTSRVSVSVKDRVGDAVPGSSAVNKEANQSGRESMAGHSGLWGRWIWTCPDTNAAGRIMWYVLTYFLLILVFPSEHLLIIYLSLLYLQEVDKDMEVGGCASHDDGSGSNNIHSGGDGGYQ